MNLWLEVRTIDGFVYQSNPKPAQPESSRAVQDLKYLLSNIAQQSGLYIEVGDDTVYFNPAHIVTIHLRKGY